MLLGLAVAVLLALMLQLNALRARRTPAFECAHDGIIHLKAWIVLEARDEPAARAIELARQVLLLPSRLAGQVRRRLRSLGSRRRFGATGPWKARRGPIVEPPGTVARPPGVTPDRHGDRWRSPWRFETAQASRRPPGPPRRAFCIPAIAVWSQPAERRSAA